MKPERRDFLKLTAGAVAGGLAGTTLPLVAAERFDSAAVAALQRQVHGSVVARGSSTYEVWRQSMIWNYRKFARYPDVIVQAEDEDDVVAAINFARRYGLQITSRGGGHSWSGCFLRDGGVLVDLSRLQALQIDTDARMAHVQPGVLGRILNWRLGEVGLAFPTAHCGMVPVSGFLLGGGLGLNSVAWGGMSVFNIEAIDLVNAGGERLHASATENADYFWAARGGGPGLFFTVTRFHLRCYPLPRCITTDTYILPFDELVELSSAMGELGPQIDPRLEMLTVVVPAPVAQTAGERVAVLAATAFADTPQEAQKMLGPVAAHPVLQRPLSKIDKRPTPFEVLYQDNEGPFPQRRARADNIYTDRVVEAATVLSRHMPGAPSPGNTPVILWRGTVDFPSAAYSARGSFYFATYAQWDSAASDGANEQWLKALYAEMEPLATGHYINEFDRETHAAQTASCFAPANWLRLHELRRKYDPDPVFQTFLGNPT
jgi:FAD/FMN-containing dehydrogenase